MNINTVSVINGGGKTERMHNNGDGENNTEDY